MRDATEALDLTKAAMSAVYRLEQCVALHPRGQEVAWMAAKRAYLAIQALYDLSCVDPANQAVASTTQYEALSSPVEK